MTGRRLEITLLDVGWGDSILIEANDGTKSTFALVDSNDTATYPSSLIFLKRHFERLKYHPFRFPMFEHVFATHAHADHVNGLQSMLRTFGTTNFYYSACDKKKNVTFANTLRWLKKAKRNKAPVAKNHKAIAQGQTGLNLGPVVIDVLWPPFNSHKPWNAKENNNSLVLALTLDQVCFLLTGDCLADNWDTSKHNHVAVPQDTHVAQHPHHGAKNGMFDAGGNTPLLDQVVKLNALRKKKGGKAVVMGLSSHIRPHGHPKKAVIDELDLKSVTYYRTDQHCHTTFRTDGSTVEVCYSHT